MTLKKLVISCGGTGGHFYPGLSLARQVKARGGVVRLQLSGVNSEAQAKIAADFGIEADVLPLMPSPHGLKNTIKFLRGAAEGFIQAKKSLRKFAPDAVMGMGSFASLPTLLAAQRLHVPIFLHDGNARIGKANRLFSRFAHMVFTAFPPVNCDKVKAPVLELGMPVRPEMTPGNLTHTEALSQLNKLYDWQLSAEKPIILVTGGSQGARTLNVAAAAAAAELQAENVDLQLVHLCGKSLLNETERLYQTLNCKVNLLPVSEQMALLYRVADAVVARSGGSTVAELITYGKYAVLCPYPYAAEHHQHDNARHMVSLGAAELIENADFTVAKAADVLRRLALNCAKYRKLGENAQNNIHKNAADAILDEIERFTHKKL